MRERVGCKCAICVIERLLFIFVEEPLGAKRFLKLGANSPVLATFPSPSALIHHLHGQRDHQYRSPLASEVLAALIQAGSTVGDPEMSQSVLALAFMPAIHRTYREVCGWFRELEPEDIAQQVLTLFLGLAATAPIDSLNGILPIILARSLRKSAFRWAEKEYRFQLRREIDKQGNGRNAEPAANDRFEAVSILNDFLDYCCQIGTLSRFERDLLTKIRIEGYLMKETANPVLSTRAVEGRIQRILKKLQKVALPGASGQPESSKITGVEKFKDRKDFSQSAGIFSLRSFSDFLPISKSRRQLSLDIPPRRVSAKTQQFSTPKQDSHVELASSRVAN